MEGLRGHTTGFAVPTFVVDAPGGGGKIPLGPNYLVSMGERSVVVRNFEGVLVRVEDPPAEPLAARDASADDEPAEPPQSVSDLVSGRGKRLVPGGLDHYDRRRGGTGRLRKRARPASGNGAPAASGRSGNGASPSGNGNGSASGNGAHAPHLAAVPGRGKGSGARRKLS
jgi:hypothetical protein